MTSDKYYEMARQVVECRCGSKYFGGPRELCNHVGFDEVADALRAAVRKALEEAARLCDAASARAKARQDAACESNNWASINSMAEARGCADSLAAAIRALMPGEKP